MGVEWVPAAAAGVMLLDGTVSGVPDRQTADAAWSRTRQATLSSTQRPQLARRAQWNIELEANSPSEKGEWIVYHERDTTAVLF